MKEFVVCNSLAADIRVSEGMFYNQILVKTGGMSSWVWICLRSIVFSTNWQMRDTEFQMVQVFLEIMNSVPMLARRQCWVVFITLCHVMFLVS